MFQLATSQPQFPLFLSHVLIGTALFPSSCQEGKIQNCQPVPRKKHAHNKTSRTQTGEPPLRRERQIIWIVRKKKMCVLGCVQVQVIVGDQSKQTQARQLINRWRCYLIILHALHLFLSDRGRKGVLQITKWSAFTLLETFFNSVQTGSSKTWWWTNKSGVRWPISKYECSVRVKTLKIRSN